MHCVLNLWTSRPERADCTLLHSRFGNIHTPPSALTLTDVEKYVCRCVKMFNADGVRLFPNTSTQTQEPKNDPIPKEPMKVYFSSTTLLCSLCKPVWYICYVQCALIWSSGTAELVYTLLVSRAYLCSHRNPFKVPYSHYINISASDRQPNVYGVVLRARWETRSGHVRFQYTWSFDGARE